MSVCTHCDEGIITAIYDENDIQKKSPFCCNGCLTVFHIIHQKGLENYYEIKKQSAIYKRRSPVEQKNLQFLYLDEESFIKEYTYKSINEEATIEFYLEGIHCLACLWLIEKLPEFLTDVKRSRLDLNRSVATITLGQKGKFSRVAQELNNLGYKPHPLRRNQDVILLKRNEERKMLLKIGLAGAGAGNVMLYAISNYAGAPGNLAEIFNILTISFALPVIIYSASPFYVTAWNAIKNKSLSIDIPISISLILGTLFSFYQLIIGETENYLDGLTALIFLLLLSRYFLNKIQNDSLMASDLNFFHQDESVLKKNQNQFTEIHHASIEKGDVLKILPNQMIPADGMILEGNSSVNNSLLTGESKAVEVNVGARVFSGTLNLENEIIVQVDKVRDETRLGQILSQVKSGWIQKSRIVALTNRVSKYFLITVFVLAGFIFVHLSFLGDIHQAVERAITLLIVTCPCALALATPLTLTRTLSLASRNGIIIKDDEIIEKLSSVDQIFLDKTGTITYGKLKVTSFNQILKTKIPIFNVIFSLEQKSSHPVANALKEFAKGKIGLQSYEVKNYQESIGKGVSGQINKIFYEINRGQIFEENYLVAEFKLEDMIRPESREVIRELSGMNIGVSLISGDQKPIVEEMSRNAGISLNKVFSETSPEDKLKILEKEQNAMMVGDGANDAMALSKAYVGVAVLGAMDISLRAADIYLTTPGIKPISDLIVISKETMNVVYRNLVLSLAYNCISVYAAFTGIISPLIAAIIMPLSSLTVLVSTLIGTKKLNNRLNIKLEKN